jgi:hypothetical protein
MAKICVSQSRGCWVDLYERTNFRGRKIRLFGPGDYVNLWIASEDWGEEAASLVAGPAAFVQCFAELNFEDSVVWFIPGQQVADAGRLPLEWELDSIRVFDRPPFASEPGFDAYARADREPPPPLRIDRPETGLPGHGS